MVGGHSHLDPKAVVEVVAGWPTEPPLSPARRLQESAVPLLHEGSHAEVGDLDVPVGVKEEILKQDATSRIRA